MRALAVLETLAPAAWWNGRHSRLKICFWETGVPVRVRARPPKHNEIKALWCTRSGTYFRPPFGSIYVRTVSVRIVPKLIGRASGHANGAAGLFPPPALGERCHRSLAASVKKCITRPAATTGTQLVGSRVSVPVALRNHRLSISEYPVNAAPTKVIDGRAAQTFRTSAMIPSPLVCCPVARPYPGEPSLCVIHVLRSCCQNPAQ